MNLEFGPILRALMRNKLGAILIAVQIAVTMTILANGFFIIQERRELIARESGVDIANSFHIQSTGFAPDFDPRDTITRDLDMIRATPGVVDAIQINAIPISGGGWSMGLQTEPGDEIDATGVAVYMVDSHGLEALDVELIAGEFFSESDIGWRDENTDGWPDKIVLTQTMVESLWPDSDYAQAVGKTAYINGDEPMVIIGIVDKLQAPWIGWNNLEHAMLSPERLAFNSGRYFIRTEPGQRDRIMTEVEEALANAMPGRMIQGLRSMEETRQRSYQQHDGMIKILTTIMITLTFITAMGIVGLASFSVNRRKKQIGTRRALGASQAAILRYFMLENFLISSFGVILGAALTVGLNITLVSVFSLNRIDWYYIPLGMAILWVVGQLAVFGPAKRAASIPPALATRSV